MSDILDTPVFDLTNKEDMEGDMPEIKLVAKHQHAQVKLPANPTTGYDWCQTHSHDNTECSPRCKELSRYFEVPGGQTRMGQNGVLTITFEGQLEGEQIFQYDYMRSCESETTSRAKMSVKFKIKVGGDIDKPPCN